MGLYGAAAVVILSRVLILRILSRAEAQKNGFARNPCFTVASILFIHFFVNIGMSIGVVPTIGIPYVY